MGTIRSGLYAIDVVAGRMGRLSLLAAARSQTLIRINSLIKETLRTPFVGIGKPEPLKSNLKGWWSRRISREHRLVYRVESDMLIIMQCRFHYAQ